jgi:hypothetical protein
MNFTEKIKKMKRNIFISVFVCLLVANSNGQIVQPATNNQGQPAIDSPITDCSICSKQLLTEAHLAGKCIEELELLRTEIFARHGYHFESMRYESYFAYKSWYQALYVEDADDVHNAKIKLSSVETKNVNFIKSIEKKLHQIRNMAFSDLRALKTALNNNDKAYLDKIPRSRLHEEQSISTEMWQEIKKILNHINIDNINCVKCKCLNKTSFDNGFWAVHYKVYTEGDKLYVIADLSNNEYNRSETFGSYNDGYSWVTDGGGDLFGLEFTMQKDGLVLNEYIAVN